MRTCDSGGNKDVGADGLECSCEERAVDRHGVEFDRRENGEKTRGLFTVDCQELKRARTLVTPAWSTALII